MIPKRCDVKFLLRSSDFGSSRSGKKNIKTYLEEWIRYASEHPDDPQAIENIRAICVHCIKGAHPTETADFAFNELIELLPKKDPCPLGDLVIASDRSLTGVKFSIQTLTALGTLLGGLGFNACIPKYAPPTSSQSHANLRQDHTWCPRALQVRKRSSQSAHVPL